MYFCIDLKSFYASVECALRGLDPFKTPLVVCDVSHGSGAITLSVTPFLKKLGIPSRTRAYLLPKDLNIIYARPRMKLYISYSLEVYKIYLSFFSKEDVFMYSIDEGFMYVSPYLNYYQMCPRDLALKIKEKIFNELSLHVCVGIGDNMFQSKIALDVLAKHNPDGIALVNDFNFKTLLWPLDDLSSVWCIGPRLKKRLMHLGIFTLRDLATTHDFILKNEFGIIGLEMKEHASGIDETTIFEAKEASMKESKIMSSSQILLKDYEKKSIYIIVSEMVDELALKICKKNKVTNQIYLRIGYSKNQIPDYEAMLNINYTYDYFLLNKYYKEMLNRAPSFLIRRVSIIFHVRDSSKLNQSSIFISDNQKIKNMYDTIGIIKERYGKNSIIKALSLLEDSRQIERNQMIGGHNAI